MNIVFIIPTGIGCEIGGHAGDATPAAKLIASLCDKLIINPNVVNASSFNEMTENMLYVEGSMIDTFLAGKINLKFVESNNILLTVNKPLNIDVINTVSVVNALIGIDVKIVELDIPLIMKGYIKNKIATGDHSGVDELITQVGQYEYDALAIATEIIVDKRVALNYFRNGGVNPWGGIEAIVSKKISKALNKPVVHGPIESQETLDNDELLFLPYNEIVDKRMAAEVISTTYIYCLFKGLLKAPRPCMIIEGNLNWTDIDFLISPYGCIGEPHKSCGKNNIPIIVVKENKTVLNDGIPKNAIVVESYVEAAGVIATKKTGVTIDSVRVNSIKSLRKNYLY